MGRVAAAEKIVVYFGARKRKEGTLFFAVCYYYMFLRLPLYVHNRAFVVAVVVVNTF